ncbi:MAG: efflux RND transporter periplasmic adaptor subunit [Phycisphaerales bacterium]|nr:efflux RND transporter periplasmic adaptor subunit [Phycisphaerales bacterium]
MIGHTGRSCAWRPIASLAVLSALSGCVEQPHVPQRPTTVPVRTATVVSETIALHQTLPGFTVSPRSIEIDARVEGFLLKQAIPDGAITKPDEVVYRIDPRPFEAALAAAEGQLVTATAQRDYAKKEMERNAPLVKISAISQQNFDQLVANYQEAEGQVLTAQANVTSATINLSYCTMTAPFVGLLGPSRYFEGAVVGTAATQNLNSLVQLDPMWAQFSPAASSWPAFRARMAGGPLAAKVVFGGNETITAPAKVIFVDNQASTSTATLMMRVEFANPTAIFRPGVYVNVEVALGDQPDTLVIPQEALFARETDLFVWRVKPDDTVETVRVEVLRKLGPTVALKSGPAPGDRIVVDGIQRLKPGSKVAEAPPRTPPAGQSPPVK